MLQALILLIQSLFAAGGQDHSIGAIRSEMTGSPETYESASASYNSANCTVTVTLANGNVIVIDPDEAN